MPTAEPAPGRDDRIHRRLALGEETALGELYDRYAPLVHGLAGRILDDPAEVEQLTREVFGHLWVHPDAFDPREGSLDDWFDNRARSAAPDRLGPDRADGHEGRARCADDPLDPAGPLRRQVLDWCLARRPPTLPIPPWAAPYAAESAKLDALLRDLGPAEWQEVAELPWHGGVQRWRPAEVLCHLAAVDGYLAPALGLADPVTASAAGVLERTEQLATAHAGADPAIVRALWRQQSRALIRSAALEAAGSTPVDYGFAVLPLRDAFVDRAFECWIHGDDIARAVDYPYTPPAPRHLRLMIDLAARMLPAAVAAGRGQHVHAQGGRLLRLVVEGPAAGEWLVPLDGPTGEGEPVASMVLDGLEFCYLAAAHRHPDHIPVGEYGDRAAVREVLRAAPLLSRP